MPSDLENVHNRCKARRRVRGLIVSYNCNLNCIYCYIHNKSFFDNTHRQNGVDIEDDIVPLKAPQGKTMPVDIAQRAIIDIFKEGNTIGYDEIEIDFVGAEPLTVYENLKYICEWFWSNEWSKPNIFFATTNGTLLDDEMKNWFYLNRNRFVLGLSCDGNIKTQNINRSDSGLSIDYDFFLNTWPDQPLKMTISENTVGYLSENIIYLQERGFLLNANPANGMNSWQESHIKEYGRQLIKLLQYYLRNPEMPPSSLFSIGLPAILDSFHMKSTKYCGAGEGYDIIDVDGERYPCHMFSPLVLSESRLELIDNIDFSRTESFEDIKCRDCILKKICPSCYGLNFKTYGDPAIREKILCELFILQVMANCKYHIYKLSGKKNISFEEQQTAKAVKLIYDKLKCNEPRL
jgi:uncharacterized protein